MGRGVFVLFLLISSLLFASCINPFMEPILGVKTISFNTNGGSLVPEQILIKGEKVVRPSDPVKDGYEFTGWYEDNISFESEWNFNAFASSNLTLYAKWLELAAVVDMELVNPPRLEYIHGDVLDLSALSVILYYDDGSELIVVYDNFNSINIKTNISNSEVLRRYLHNGTELEVTIGNITIPCGELLVSQKLINIADIAHTKIVDGNTDADIDPECVVFEGLLPEDAEHVFAAVIEAEYTSPEIGTVTINIISMTLGGERADNYIITMPVYGYTIEGGIRAKAEQSFEFNVNEILDSNIDISSGVVLYRSTGEGKEVTITGENISAIEWYYSGEEISASAVSNNGRTITLVVSSDPANNAYNAPYNVIGRHLLTVVITVNNTPYSRKIEFEVVN